MPVASKAANSPRGWIPLEDRYYQRSPQYSALDWPLTPALLSNGVIAAAPNAGPLAIVPDFGWALNGFALSVYSLSGKCIKQYERIRERALAPVRAVALGWSKGDLLTVVYGDGGVVRVNIGRLPNVSAVYQISGSKDRAERVFDAVVLESGDVIARGVSGTVYRLTADNVPVHDNLVVPPPIADAETVTRASIASIPSVHSIDGDVETLLLNEKGTLVRNNVVGHELLAFDERISQFAVSANGKYLALVVSGTSTLVVTTIDLTAIIARVDLSKLFIAEPSKEPASISWVGSDAVAAFYDEAIALIGPRGEVTELEIDEVNSASELVPVTEVDGLRIISPFVTEFIHLVPSSVHSVFCNEKDVGFKLLGASGAPSKDCFVCADGSLLGPLVRYKMISELRDADTLRAAARKCAQAAILVDDPFEQKALLRATVYGHRFDAALGNTPPPTGKLGQGARKKYVRHRIRDEDLVPTAAAVLRVINAARTRDVGVPVSKAQFEQLGLSGLVSRLSLFGQHTTALNLAAYGQLPPGPVLKQWAVACISTDKDSTPDGELAARIIDRFESVERYLAKDSQSSGPGRALPYVGAADAAFALGRGKCAELLLRKEHRPAPKVAMFLKMDRESPAVVAAVASNDPELVLEVLGTVLKKNKSFRTTAKLLKGLPPAISNRAIDLFASHLRQIEDYSLLRLLFLETGRVREAALVDIIAADGIADAKEREEALEKTSCMIGGGRHRRSCYFEVQTLKHATTVAASAFEVEKRAGLDAGTLRKANDSDLLAHAIRDIPDPIKRRETLSWLRREIHIPDRRFFWVCLDVMAEQGDFQSVEALSNSAGSGRPPPIGLLPFVDACLKCGQEAEAVKYAYRIPDLRDRARALARCGLGREATNLAVKLRNKQLQEEVAELAHLHATSLPSPRKVG